jgi:NAD(P)-dependent dehydrogenase (short-subunit alcohol dehydrogenase family)
VGSPQRLRLTRGLPNEGEDIRTPGQAVLCEAHAPRSHCVAQLSDLELHRRPGSLTEPAASNENHPQDSPPARSCRPARRSTSSGTMRCPGDAATLETSASGRIVNVSSGLGSLTQIGDSTSEFAVFIFIGYGASKAALNMLTVQAAEPKDSGINVNSADQDVRPLASTAIEVARPYRRERRRPSVWRLLPDDGPTGGFSSADHPQPR